MINRTFRLGLVASTFLFCFAIGPMPSFGQQQARITVSLYSTCAIKTDVVRISDLGKVYCRDQSLLEKIGLLDVDVAPSEKRKSKRITQSQVQIRLRLAGYENVRVIGANATTVSRSSDSGGESGGRTQVASPLTDAWKKTLSKAIQQKLSLHHQVPRDFVSIEITSVRGTFAVGTNPTEFEVEILNSLDQLIGNQSITLLLKKSGVAPVKLSIQTSIFITKNVIVATEDLSPGTTLGPNDVTFEKRTFDNQKVNSAFTTLPKSASVRASVPRGRTLEKRHLSQIRRSPRGLLKRNDVVTVIAEKGRIRVALAGAICLDGGSEGDSIRVKNPKTNRIIRAKIVSANEVRAIY